MQNIMVVIASFFLEYKLVQFAASNFAGGKNLLKGGGEGEMIKIYSINPYYAHQKIANQLLGVIGGFEFVELIVDLCSIGYPVTYIFDLYQDLG